MLVRAAVSKAVIDVLSASLFVSIILAVVREHLTEVGSDGVSSWADQRLDVVVGADFLSVRVVAELGERRFSVDTVWNLIAVSKFSMYAHRFKVRELIGCAKDAVFDTTELIEHFISVSVG
jgi:hypothetical protein